MSQEDKVDLLLKLEKLDQEEYKTSKLWVPWALTDIQSELISSIEWSKDAGAIASAYKSLTKSWVDESTANTIVSSKSWAEITTDESGKITVNPKGFLNEKTFE